MKMNARVKRVVVGFTFGVLVAVGVIIATLFSGTPAPTPKALDYLKVIRSLSGIQSRVETQLSSGGAARALPDITEAERRQVREESGGIVRQIGLRPDGSLNVDATIASAERGSDAERVPVKLLLVPEKVGQQYGWHCFGTPVSSLPSFCKKLE